MNSTNYISLLHKRCAGKQLDIAEQNELDQWLEASKNNELLAREVEMIWNSSTDLYKDYVPNKTEGWEKLLSKLDVSDQQEHIPVKKLNPRFNLLRIAAAIVLLVGLGSVFMWMNQSNDLLVASTGLDEQKELILSDGSKVLLNKNSTLTYASEFDSNSRKVNLSGEAFFEVSKNPEAPFIIKTAKSSVTVLGTSFNVRAYPNENNTEVAVRTGKVKLSSDSGNKSMILSKHQTGRLDHQKSKLSSITGNTSLNELSWMTNKMIFRNTSLLEVEKAIEDHYDVEISFQNVSLYDCHFSASFDLKNQTLSDILDALTVVFQLEAIQSEDAQIEILGGSCN